MLSTVIKRLADLTDLLTVCLGVHLAKLELRLAVARFFIEFPGAEVSALEGMSDEDMEPKIFFMMAPKGKRCLIECR